MAKINLKDYPAPAGLSDAQATEMINSKIAQCPEIKSAKTNPDIGIASVKGKYNNYTVEHKYDKIRVNVKMNYGVSVILSALCAPFAVWFGYAFDFSKPYTGYALPLALLLISFGVFWFYGYTEGDKEQKIVLKYIYNVLNNQSTSTLLDNTKSVGANKLIAIVPFILGVVVLVTFFTSL